MSGVTAVIYPIGLSSIDIGSKCLCNCLDGAFYTTICLLLNGGRWYKVNIESFVEFYKEIGYKLWSSIRDDFIREFMIAEDLTYIFIDDISCSVFFFHQH